MRKLSLWMQVSLDGFTQGPAGEFDWPVVNEEVTQYFVYLAGEFDTFLFGRKVYELMAEYWPTADTQPSSTDYDRKYAPIWRDTPKIVFSRTLGRAGWNTEVVGENIAEQIMKLKEQPGKGLVLFGGADMAATLIRLGLIDEYRLFVHPVILGGGTPLFPAFDDRVDLRLVQTRTFDSAVVHVHYQREGERV
jgi:dihydrofolate reductase